MKSGCTSLVLSLIIHVGIAFGSHNLFDELKTTFTYSHTSSLKVFSLVLKSDDSLMIVFCLYRL